MPLLVTVKHDSWMSSDRLQCSGRKRKVIQEVKPMRLIVLSSCGASGSTTFFQIISQKTRFSKKKENWTNIKYILFSAKKFVWNIYVSKQNWAIYWHRYSGFIYFQWRVHWLFSTDLCDQQRQNVKITLYRVSHELRSLLRESVP